MSNAPIIDQLLKLYNQDIVSFHVPGHKNGRIYNKITYKDYKDILCNIDTTEIAGTDNLHNAKEMIKKSQDKASRVFGSDETFYLVNGSTSGIYSMIMAATSPGDKILIDRNCHQSVINAVLLGDLTPIYVYPHMDEVLGIAMGISQDEVEKKLKEHTDIKAVVLTYPTYHGIACDLKKIAEIVHKYDKILLIDEAHGAHFGLSKELPPTALSCGADAVVQSTHKTLSSFTQSSMLHVKGNKIDREKLRLMLRIHQSSSPSYLLLSSLDLAVMIYETQGEHLMRDLIKNINSFKKELKKIKEIRVLGDEIVGKHDVATIDPTRLWISLDNMSGYELDEILRERFHIQVELSNIYGVLAIASIASVRNDFDRLLNALETIGKEGVRKKRKDLQPFTYRTPEQVLTPREALYKEKTKVLLKESIGFISGEYIIPYPPGIPVVIPGEIINQETIQYIETILSEGMEVLGPKDSTCRSIEILKIPSGKNSSY